LDYSIWCFSSNVTRYTAGLDTFWLDFRDSDLHIRSYLFSISLLYNCIYGSGKSRVILAYLVKYRITSKVVRHIYARYYLDDRTWRFRCGRYCRIKTSPPWRDTADFRSSLLSLDLFRRVGNSVEATAAIDRQCPTGPRPPPTT